MKILADDDLSALLSVVGIRSRAEPLTIELPGSTTRADLLARTPDGVVHVEFVKDPAPDLDLRMVDYRLRLRRRERDVIAACTGPDRRKLLLGVATTLASITLPAATIDSALKEAHMPVPVRDTPLGRELLELGRQEGRQEGERAAVERLLRRMLLRQFGTDPRIEAVAARLAELPEDEGFARVETAAALDDLAT